jgi:hypothetical protein
MRTGVNDFQEFEMSPKIEPTMIHFLRRDRLECRTRIRVFADCRRSRGLIVSKSTSRRILKNDGGWQCGASAMALAVAPIDAAARRVSGVLCGQRWSVNAEVCLLDSTSWISYGNRYPRANKPTRTFRPQISCSGASGCISGLLRLVQRQWGEDAGDAAGQHRLPRAGRADHQDVMRPRRGDFRRALDVLLAPHVREVRVSPGSRAAMRWGGRRAPDAGRCPAPARPPA